MHQKYFPGTASRQLFTTEGAIESSYLQLLPHTHHLMRGFPASSKSWRLRGVPGAISNFMRAHTLAQTYKWLAHENPPATSSKKGSSVMCVDA